MRPPELFAVALLHGPAELLPISSSAHVGLLLADLEPEERKELEVAVHAGTLLALGLPRPRAWLIASTLPAAVAGALFEQRIERLGPRTTAFGLVAGGIAMALADIPRTGEGAWHLSDFGVPGSGEGAWHLSFFGDGLVVGLAQAAALVPGVSRHGAALTALRALGFGRAEAQRLSWEAARPVLLGATLLKGVRAVQRGGADPAALAAAAAGSAISTRVAMRALAGRPLPLWPFALYRAALAGSVLRMARQPVPLQGRVVAITGGAGGIGRCLAAELVRRGAKVAIGDVDLTHAPDDVFSHPLDVTDRASFEAFLDAAAAELGPVDVLVNNAGIAPIHRFGEEDDQTTRRTVEINVLGVMTGSKLALARGVGHIVNIASGAGKLPVEGLATYTASKHAVVGLSETLKMETRGTGVEISVVLPGPVETRMIAGTRRTPVLRAVEPEDAATAIADAIARPRFEVWIPRQNAVLNKLVSPLPVGARHAINRAMGLHRMYTEADRSQRGDYDERIAERV
jgi:NAD(P)-dependent dehydrogenase (short-subunit alcohol dehydrogenase family)/undecaprenyl pyrophosphate phosphatase UppP